MLAVCFSHKSQMTIVPIEPAGGALLAVTSIVSSASQLAEWARNNPDLVDGAQHIVLRTREVLSSTLSELNTWRRRPGPLLRTNPPILGITDAADAIVVHEAPSSIFVTPKKRLRISDSISPWKVRTGPFNGNRGIHYSVRRVGFRRRRVSRRYRRRAFR